MDDAAIAVERISKIYPDGTTALTEVTLDIPYGETFGCLGRNGAGKTTLVNVLATLATPTGGTARICGLDVVRNRARVRRRIGASLQQVALDELMTGREHMSLIARLAGLSNRAATSRSAELVELFGLGALIDKTVAVYSGGTRRRLDLALALIRQPAVLFLDEPTTGLDPQNRRALWDWVGRFAREGGTVLLTTQYLEEADTLADRIGVLDGGGFGVIDSPRGLKARYGGKLVLVRPADSAERDRLHREFGALERSGPIQLDATQPGRLRDIVTRLGELGVPETSFEIREPTLEDVFIRLTGQGAGREEPVEVAAGVAAIGRSLVAPRGRRDSR